ncbi:hypothetical protein [Sphingosinicella sp. BN140058]|uniref:hypothetical protein n=1 Tax=Sphingosinicella sp. BN140058 TaxID=1892855 RepID=UPI0010105147|nr:hypothetical protein [Sphingosinicella sp. BN140058]QAY75254.1 hypothetical protein ETR14_00930 [Sphingosinicella sp. BN140058]
MASSIEPIAASVSARAGPFDKMRADVIAAEPTAISSGALAEKRRAMAVFMACLPVREDYPSIRLFGVD